MLLIVLALLWIALLTPVVLRRVRDARAERSIDSFHHEHEVLNRQPHSVEPIHRLADYPSEVPAAPMTHRARLTVVHADDTYGTLESRASWEEWSQDYDYDDPPMSDVHSRESNRYAAAYSHAHQPIGEDVATPVRHHSMRRRRKLIFSRLVAGAVVLTLIGFVSGFAPFTYLAVVDWMSVVGYVAAAVYAIRQGYLRPSSISRRLVVHRSMATVQPLYEPTTERYVDYDEYAYEDTDQVPWPRTAPRRRAIG